MLMVKMRLSGGRKTLSPATSNILLEITGLNKSSSKF
jgi:hypothetical protein